MTRATRLLAGWTVLALALTACSGGSDPGSSASSGGPGSSGGQVPSGSTSSLPPPIGARPPLSHPLVDHLEVRWVAEGGPSGCGLDVDSEAVYWADEWDGGIRRLSKANGEVTMLAERQGGPAALAVDDRHAFWIATSSERLRRAPKTGGAFGGLAAEVSVPLHLAIDDTDAFFTRERATREADALVLRVPKRGGEPVVLVRGELREESRAIALDATHVYFVLDVEAIDRGAVKRVAKTGGEVETLASGLSSPEALAVDEQFVYFTTRGNRNDGEIRRLPKAGGAAVTLYKGGGVGKDAAPIALALALDATHVFFIDASGVVRRVPKTGGEVQTLADLLDSGRAGTRLALDESTLWVCGSQGLWKLSWNPIPGVPQLFPTHGSSSRSLLFDRGGHLVGADWSGVVRLYDVVTGRTVSEVKNGQQVREMGFAADGQTLIIGDGDGGIEGWDLTTGARKWANAPTDRKLATTEVFALSPDGTLILHRRGGGPLRLVSTQSGNDLRRVDERTYSPEAIAIAPDNTFFLTAAERPRRIGKKPAPPLPKDEPPLRMWDMATGKQIAAFTGEAEVLFAIAFSRDGKHAISAGEDGLLRVWDIATRAAVTTFKTSGPIHDVVFSRSGERALTISPVEGTCLWDLTAKKRLACHPARGRSPNFPFRSSSVIFSPAEDEAWWSIDHGYRRWKLPQ